MNKISQETDPDTIKEEVEIQDIDTKCSHDWHNNYDCFEDAVIRGIDDMGIPVKCENCKLEGIEWWTYSCVRDADRRLID